MKRNGGSREYHDGHLDKKRLKQEASRLHSTVDQTSHKVQIGGPRLLYLSSGFAVLTFCPCSRSTPSHLD